MPINFDFPLFLTALVVLTGIMWIVNYFVFAKQGETTQSKIAAVFDYGRSFFPALLLVWIIRSFIVQPYRVPTGSLEPTVLPGDFIIVKQYSYGLRLPVTQTKIWATGEPKRGDIALFYWPVDTSVRFVKRVIGLPGDHIEYKDKVLTINGKTMTQKEIGPDMTNEPGYLPQPVIRKQENLDGVVHDIIVQKQGGDEKSFDITVPAGSYFMMGDNRDGSDDSRYWGFVPEANLIGQAFGVWLSWDSNNKSLRWSRMFKGVS